MFKVKVPRIKILIYVEIDKKFTKTKGEIEIFVTIVDNLIYVANLDFSFNLFVFQQYGNIFRK